MKIPWKIKKILNNNAVISTDKNGREVVILGNGIGFHTRVGYYVHPEKVLNVYTLQNNESYSQIETLLNEISFECFIIAEKIINLAQAKLKKEFNSHLILALADHINFAIKQARKNIKIPNLITEEINRFYKEEYNIGLLAVDMINKEYSITLPRSEATSIAFHLIDAESTGSSDETTTIIKETGIILQIIVDSLKLKLSEDSLNYSRLVTHTKYFLKRVLTEERSTQPDLSKVIVFNEEDELYQKISLCLKKVENHLKHQFNYQVTMEERLYLLLHIMAVIQTD